MKSFDKYLKKKISEEQIEVPQSVKNHIEKTLQELPEMEVEKKHPSNNHHFVLVTACIIFITMFLLPNISIAYAETIEKIPIIGDIVRVVTIRNYYYSDKTHELDIKIPEIESDNEIFSPINSEIKELTDTLLKEFNEVGDNGHSSLYIDYNVVTNTDTWFTLKIQVIQATGSGNITYKYYHYNKVTEKIMTLSDIAMSEELYKKIEQEIKKQMLEEMKRDRNKVYWINDDTFGNTVHIDSKHNFYWDENGNLIIPFDKYEVAPGYMGSPEFVINKNKIKNDIKKEILDIIK